MKANQQKPSIGQLLITRIDTAKIRYLLAGGWNTLFGYASGLFLYYGMDGRISVIAVGFISNILAITMAFLTYKVFVFRTKGDWFVEYIRTYVVYGAMAIFGVLLLWVSVDVIGLPFWLAQGLIIMPTIIISYIGHSRFTFRKDQYPTM